MRERPTGWWKERLVRRQCAECREWFQVNLRANYQGRVLCVECMPLSLGTEPSPAEGKVVHDHIPSHSWKGA